MILIRVFLLSLALLPFSGSGLGAETNRNLVLGQQGKAERVAVVIGNSRYPSGALANPRNDATAMAEALGRLGFDVELKLDAAKGDMDAVFKRFATKAETATVAAVFYAGHGIQVAGSNYIVPIDANPKSERDLKREMIKMDDIIDDMGAARVKLVFFDACRDNPLSRSFSRGGSRGMAAPVEATGTLISFATKHGNTAADGEGRHSPYTSALLAALDKPDGIEIEQLLRRVQQGVKQATNGQQEPWRYGSLDGDFFFKAAVSVDTARMSQEAVERAVIEATRRANEQAARERAELQASLRAQQEASDRALAETIRRNNEQAAKERAELQASMEKMLAEALARQTAALEAERKARLPAALPVATTAPPAPAAAEPMRIALSAPTVASRPPTHVAVAAADLAAGSIHAGDEWEYIAKDEMFGKTNTLVLRVKAVSPQGVLEELVWNGRSTLDWVFDGKLSALATPNEAHFLISPHWKGGGDISGLIVEGGTSACTASGRTCTLSLKRSGTEKLVMTSGTYDAVRFEGHISIRSTLGATFTQVGNVKLWYSIEHGRLLKQAAEAFGSVRFKESVELAAIRRKP